MGQTMRDNAKGGALTEVTFYILLSLYTPKHGYAVMQFIEEKTGGRLSWNEPQKLDKKRIKRPQRSEFCIAQDSGRLVLI